METRVVDIIFMIPALLFAVIMHELAHGAVAYLLGDDTAKREGRLTLNPIPHIDPLGSLLLPGLLMLVGSGILFGWAKPVPVNPYNFKKVSFRSGNALVSSAGPVINILLTLVFSLLYKLFTNQDFLAWMASTLGLGFVESVVVPLAIFFKYSVLINLILAIFNLLPIPPLDGGHILLSLLPPRMYEKIAPYEVYGFFILILLLFSGALGFIIRPVYTFLLSIFL